MKTSNIKVGNPTRDTSKKRNSILEAAVKAFQKYGYEYTSMDKIAEEANASKRTVYNHFQSKDVLFHAVIDKFTKVTTVSNEIYYNSNISIRDQLAEFVNAEITNTENKNWLATKKALISVFIRDTDLAKEMMTKHGSGNEPLEKWLLEANQDGKLNIKDSKTAATVFKAMISGTFTWPALFIGPLPPEDTKNLRDELIETFLCRYERK